MNTPEIEVSDSDRVIGELVFLYVASIWIITGVAFGITWIILQETSLTLLQIIGGIVSIQFVLGLVVLAGFIWIIINLYSGDEI